MKNIYHIKNTQKGSILVESLVSLIIVVPAIIALMSIYSNAVKNVSGNQNYNNAVYLAQQCLEDLKQFDGSPTIKSLPSAKTSPPPTTIDGVSYSVNINSFTPNDSSLDSHIYPYQVTVSWIDNTIRPATTRSIQVAAYYYSN